MEKLAQIFLLIGGIYILATTDMGKHGTVLDTVAMIGIGIVAVIGLSSRI